MFMYEFRSCLNYMYTRSHSSVVCIFELSCLHFKVDFVWSIIVFAEKSFFISWDTVVVEISLDI